MHRSDDLDDDFEMEERILTFMESMAPEQTEFLDKIEQEALGDAVPIIRTQTRSLIQFIMSAAEPHRLLEIGTGTGYSGCVMLTYAPEDAKLVTIEKDPQRAEKARNHFANLPASMTQYDSSCPSVTGGSGKPPGGSESEVPNPGKSDPAARRVTLLQGDAADILPGLSGEFDFIFMDAAKGQYIHFLPEVLRLLAPGGLLLSDNIFRDGEVLQSRYAVKRRNRTIHKRMREYLTALTRDPALQTLLLQEGDGMALTRKK